MNITEYTYLLNKPNTINDRQVAGLEQILQDFPYFQSARSLYLKALFKQQSFKYNTSLKSTAAFTIDRSVLFEFITSETFIGVQKGFFEEKESELFDITVIDGTIVEALEAVIKSETSKLEKSIISSINESNQIIQDETVIETEKISSIEDELNLEKSIIFNNTETHSFQEWLQLAKIKPIIREDNITENGIVENNLSSKLEIIDKFIEANPKIQPIKKDAIVPVFPTKTEDNSYLMTETLAKIYLEQKKYSKAIQAYEILILKYPEKFTFFADRISDIQSLQQNNNS